MSVEIRHMTTEDVAAVAQIERTIFSQPWSEQGFRDALSNPDTIFLAAVQRDGNKTDDFSIVGYSGMYLAQDEGEITNVAVNEPCRGNGIASRLLSHMLQEAAKREIKKIVLEVRKSNRAAIQLYEKFQFAHVGIRKGFYSFPKEDAEIMVWERRV